MRRHNNELMTLILLITGLVTPNARAAPRPVECTALLAQEKLSLSFNDEIVTIRYANGASEEYKILQQRVIGVGEHARNLVKFSAGEVVYQNVYGCLSKVKISLSEQRDRDIHQAKCRERGAPACKK